MTPLLASKETPVPLNIVPGDLDGTLAKLKELSLAVPSASEASSKIKSTSAMKPKQGITKTIGGSQKLEIPSQVVPPPVTKNVNGEDVHYRKAQGPFYAYALGSPEAEFLFQKTPKALKAHKEEIVSSEEEAAELTLNGEEEGTASKPTFPVSFFKGAAFGNQGVSTSTESVPATITEQAEMIRRMVALENASGRETKKFNVGRVVELLGEMPNDTGSAAVQGSL
jgi:hypothetical protein